MKKFMALFFSLILIVSFCACDERQSPNEDAQRSQHNESSDSPNIAQIIIDYEKTLEDEIDKLHEKNPEYNYYFNLVDTVHCSYVLGDNTSADAIIEKYDMNNLFAGADISALGSVKMVSIVFKRDAFTEAIHRKIKQIGDEEPLITNVFVDFSRDYTDSYMPKIEYYSDNAISLDYIITKSVINLHNDRDFIIKSKAEYDKYLNDLLVIAEYDNLEKAINYQKDLYDETFFEENALIVTKIITRGSGSIKLTVNDLYISDNEVYVVVRTDVPEMCTADMQYTSFTFSVSKNQVVNVNKVITLE